MKSQKELSSITSKEYASLLELLQKQCPNDSSNEHANMILAISALKQSYRKYMMAYTDKGRLY